MAPGLSLSHLPPSSITGLFPVPQTCPGLCFCGSVPSTWISPLLSSGCPLAFVSSEVWEMDLISLAPGKLLCPPFSLSNHPLCCLFSLHFPKCAAVSLVHLLDLCACGFCLLLLCEHRDLIWLGSHSSTHTPNKVFQRHLLED